MLKSYNNEKNMAISKLNDVIILDTAGRLQNKVNLMKELDSNKCFKGIFKKIDELISKDN